MVDVSQIQDADIIVKFGGGLNTSFTEEDIRDRESADGGKNYRIDLDNRELKPRRPFTLLDTTPDAEQIRGFINLVKTDGTSEILVQTAGGNVYNYTGTQNGFDATAVATGINAAAKLRGRIEHNWKLTDEVIVTDLSLTEHVKTWDGTTLANITDGLTGDFKAKYCFVSDDRAWYANVQDNAVNFPHLIVVSEVEDYESLNTTNKPSTAIGAGDPFFLTAPDFGAVNGIVDAFGRVTISTKDGTIFNLTGSDSQDFALSSLYARSGASGDEGVIFAGNDIVYGRRGRVESLISTEQYGDVLSDDLSRLIKDEITAYKDWTIVYNERTQEIHFFEANQSVMWTFSKPVAEVGQVSPWIKNTTSHALAFQPSAVMNMIDPDDGLMYVYMGDDDGNFYRLEGTLGTGDGGTTDIHTVFVSGLVALQKDIEMSDYTGYIKYRKNQPFTVNMTFQYSGDSAKDETRQISIDGVSSGVYYGNNQYYNNNEYYGQQFTGRLLRKKFTQPGDGKDVQIKVEVTTSVDFKINEIGLRFDGSN